MRNYGKFFASMAAAYLLITGISLSAGQAGAGTGQPDARIVGGTEALPGVWPWVGVLVYAGGDLYTSQLCGTSLIRPNWAVTAAHCVDQGLSPLSIEAVFGVHDLKEDEGERYAVKAIFVHPEFDPLTLENDIALLELYENCNRDTIALVESDCSYDGVMGTTIGWGRISPNQPIYPSKLQQVSVPIVSNEECNTLYSESPMFDNPVADTMMCAGYREGGKDSCTGDSGGPLVIYCKETWRLAGLVSWGDGCGSPGFYGVYTRVSKYLDFINDICGEPRMEAYIPHITYEGPVWTDRLQVDNNGEDPAIYTLRFYNQGRTVFTQIRAMAGYGKQTINLKQLAPDASFGRVCYSDSDLQFRLSCEYIVNGGIAEFIIDKPAASSMVLYFSEAIRDAFWKGMVLSNPSGRSTTLKVTALGDGIILGSTTVRLEPYSKAVGFHTDWFADVAAAQLLRVHVTSSSSPVCGLTVTGNDDTTSMIMLPGVPRN